MRVREGDDTACEKGTSQERRCDHNLRKVGTDGGRGIWTVSVQANLVVKYPSRGVVMLGSAGSSVGFGKGTEITTNNHNVGLESLRVEQMTRPATSALRPVSLATITCNARSYVLQQCCDGPCSEDVVRSRGYG